MSRDRHARGSAAGSQGRNPQSICFSSELRVTRQPGESHTHKSESRSFHIAEPYDNHVRPQRALTRSFLYALLRPGGPPPEPTGDQTISRMSLCDAAELGVTLRISGAVLRDSDQSAYRWLVGAIRLNL